MTTRRPCPLLLVSLLLLIFFLKLQEGSMAKSVSLHARSSRQHNVVSWRDYYEMTKPNVVMLLLLTALVGMCLATPTWVNATVLICGLLGIGMLSASIPLL